MAGVASAIATIVEQLKSCSSSVIMSIANAVMSFDTKGSVARRGSIFETKEVYKALFESWQWSDLYLPGDPDYYKRYDAYKDLDLAGRERLRILRAKRRSAYARWRTMRDKAEENARFYEYNPSVLAGKNLGLLEFVGDWAISAVAEFFTGGIFTSFGSRVLRGLSAFGVVSLAFEIGMQFGSILSYLVDEPLGYVDEEDAADLEKQIKEESDIDLRVDIAPILLSFVCAYQGSVIKDYVTYNLGGLSPEELLWFNQQSWAAHFYNLEMNGISAGFNLSPMIEVYRNAANQGAMSECIESIYYDVSEATMYIMFHSDGSLYRYFNVELMFLIQFLYAMSKGEHFNYSVRNIGLSYERLAEMPRPNNVVSSQIISTYQSGSTSSSGVFTGSGFEEDYVEPIPEPEFEPDSVSGDGGTGGSGGTGGGDDLVVDGGAGAGAGNADGGGETGGSAAGGSGHSTAVSEYSFADDIFVTIVGGDGDITTYNGDYSNVDYSGVAVYIGDDNLVIYNKDYHLTICSGSTGTIFNGEFSGLWSGGDYFVTMMSSDDDVVFDTGVAASDFVTVAINDD